MLAQLVGTGGLVGFGGLGVVMRRFIESGLGAVGLAIFLGNAGCSSDHLFFGDEPDEGPGPDASSGGASSGGASPGGRSSGGASPAGASSGDASSGGASSGGANGVGAGGADTGYGGASDAGSAGGNAGSGAGGKVSTDGGSNNAGGTAGSASHPGSSAAISGTCPIGCSWWSEKPLAPRRLAPPRSATSSCYGPITARGPESARLTAIERWNCCCSIPSCPTRTGQGP